MDKLNKKSIRNCLHQLHQNRWNKPFKQHQDIRQSPNWKTDSRFRWVHELQDVFPFRRG